MVLVGKPDERLDILGRQPMPQEQEGIRRQRPLNRYREHFGDACRQVPVVKPRGCVALRNAALAMGIVLMSAVVSAQGNSPGLRPEPGMPSQQTPTPLSNVSFEQRLNEQLPLDLPFRNEAGQTVKLGEYFGRKPVILTFVYYECPMLCTEVLNGLESSLRVLNETIGKEFDVVTVSFDPKETRYSPPARRRRTWSGISVRKRSAAGTS